MRVAPPIARAVAAALAASALGLAALPAAAGPRAAEPTYYPDQWNLRVTQAVQAWGVTQGSAGTIIGVVDSGIDGEHAELQKKVVSGRNTVQNSERTGDTDGHGTFVAGVAAARGVKMLGVAPEARLMPLKVEETAALYYADTDYGQPVASALRYGFANGARVFNISLGSTVSSPEMRKAIEEIWSQGGLIFVSAGNTGQNWVNGEPAPRYPASYPQVIAVGATNRADRITGYSLTGSHVRLSAPGGDSSNGFGGNANQHAELIVGPIPGQSQYDWTEGTSFAAPHAAGVAALVWSLNPSLTNDQVAQLLFATADHPGNFTGRSNAYGFGRVNAFRAALAALPDPFAVSIDTPRQHAAVGATLDLAGWAADVRSDTPQRAASVKVYLGDDPETGQLRGEATLDQPSPDLAAVTGNPGLATTGYRLQLDLTAVPAGTQTLTVVARSDAGSVARRSISVEMVR